jgi:lipopolysaccharide/colanic/teichoic acid biosynthesis glycosyltransferase
VLTAAALLFLAPLMLTVAIFVKLSDGGPVLYRQRRIGRDGEPFYCLKFRSMAVDAEARLAALLSTDEEARVQWEHCRKLKEDPRVTRVGRFLRASSLDELPQFLNILKGDMGLDGPRPIIAAEAPYYGIHFRHYCAVRPGLTGLWQVSGRSDVSYRERVVMDVAYVRAKCLMLDLKILAATVPAVLLRRGSY